MQKVNDLQPVGDAPRFIHTVGGEELNGVWPLVILRMGGCQATG